MDMRQPFISYNNSKSKWTQNGSCGLSKRNWIHEWSPVDFIEVLEVWVKKYNNRFLPSALHD
jgi:hypothetical protein